MSRALSILALLLATALVGACSDDTSKTVDKGPSKVDTKVGGTDGTTKTCSTSSLLPADKSVSDYTKKAAADVANDATSLQALIDGGSEKYSQNKFVCMVQAIYASTTSSSEITVWIFDQTDAAGATAAMTAAVSATSTDLTPTVGDASKEDTTLVSGYVAFARKNKTLVRVSANKKAVSADAQALLKAIIAAAP
jgi:hypothetical protein